MAGKTEKQIGELLERYGPLIRDAFLEAFENIRDRSVLQNIIDRLEARDIEGAIRAVGMDPRAFLNFEQAIAQTYMAGGTFTSDDLPVIYNRVGQQLIVRFDGRNVRAEAWLRDFSSTLVRQIVADQVEMLRSRLRDSMEAGVNPRTAALDIVGRMDRATQKRVGGVIGLTSQQELWARNAAAELASGDPAQMEKWLSRKLRDKRYDPTVRKAIREGKPIPAEQRRIMLVRYHDALLKMRGDTIARTEGLTALHQAQNEALRQLVETGQVQPNQIRRIWRSAADVRVRDSHVALNGTSVGYGEAFTAPSGARIMYPHDPNAPAEEVINCRCDLTIRIDYLSNIR